MKGSRDKEVTLATLEAWHAPMGPWGGMGPLKTANALLTNASRSAVFVQRWGNKVRRSTRLIKILSKFEIQLGHGPVSVTPKSCFQFTQVQPVQLGDKLMVTMATRVGQNGK
jgi:hypothetical protein